MDAIKEERQCVRNRTSAFGVLTRGFSEGLHELVALDAEFLEEFGIFRGSAQEVFDGDEVVFEAFGFVFGAGEEVVESLRDVDLVGGSGACDFGQAVEFLFEAGAEVFDVHSGALDDRRREATSLSETCREQMLDIDLLISVASADSFRCQACSQPKRLVDKSHTYM
jgi:hypothetical protein